MFRKQGHDYHLLSEAFKYLYVFEVALFCFEVLAGMGVNLSDFAHQCRLAPPTLDPDKFLQYGKVHFNSCDTVSGAAAV